MKVDLKTTVGELIGDYRSTVKFFVARGMLCVGCPARGFHTLGDVARIHGYEPEEFLKAVREAATDRHGLPPGERRV